MQRVVQQFAGRPDDGSRPRGIAFGSTMSLGWLPGVRAAGYDVDVILREASTAAEALELGREIASVPHGDGWELKMVEEGSRLGSIGPIPAWFGAVRVSYKGAVVDVVKLDLLTKRWPNTTEPYSVAPYFSSAWNLNLNRSIVVQAVEDTVGQKIQGVLGIKPIMLLKDGSMSISHRDRYKDAYDILVVLRAVPMGLHQIVRATAAALDRQNIVAPATFDYMAPMADGSMHNMRPWWEQRYAELPLPGRVASAKALDELECFISNVLRGISEKRTQPGAIWDPGRGAWITSDDTTFTVARALEARGIMPTLANSLPIRRLPEHPHISTYFDGTMLWME
jgi:hypothetical protein